MNNRDILSRIETVMQVEATVPPRKDFLLTHVPFNNLSRGESEAISEERLFFEELLAKPEDHKLIMVLGENGCGKSHLIRWLYEKYRTHYGHDNKIEKILWIPKAHNTLQDALMQLLKSDVFPDDIKNNELEKVKNAQSAISGTELKKTINFNFTLAIEEDIEKRANTNSLNQVTLTWLTCYLKNQFILDTFLMRKNGPLDRICSKLNNIDNLRTNDYEGDVFTESDFSISLGDIKKNLEGGDNIADSNTILLAKRLMNNAGNTFRKNVADYMNSKVDEVIQKSLKLNTSDFKQLFESLRIRLKEQGMRLTLFVEDINAFTGIDLALMDVLVTNHRAQGNEECCRLCSVVGSTNDFYKNRLNDSLRDRVKDDGAEVFIREESLFGDPNRLVEFTAKYVNACMVSEHDVKKWEEENNCDDADMPLAPAKYNFSSTNCFNRQMTIFPFNKNAICNMYDKLDSLSKTPRRFLLDVVYPFLKLYYSSPEEFLDKESAFKNDSITSLNDFVKNKYTIIDRTIGGDDANQRSLLLRVWGDGTTEVRNNTLAGLDKEVFDAFGIDMMLERYKESSSLSENGSDINTDIITTTPPSNSDIITTKVKKTGDSIITSNKNETYSKIKSEISEWAKNSNMKLSYSSELRKLIYKFVYGNVSWDAEEIPQQIIEAYINSPKYFFIEGQADNIRDDGIIIKRNQESEFLLYALIGFKYLGDGSWEFEYGLDYYNIAAAWLVNHCDEIMKLVKAPYEDEIKYQELLVASMYCMKLMNGGIVFSQNHRELLQEIFSITDTVSNNHSEKWNAVVEEVLQNENYNKYFEQSVAFFSNAIGKAEVEHTNYTFIDAYKVLNIIKKLTNDDWNLQNYEVQSKYMTKQDFWCKAPKIVGIVSKNFDKLLDAEVKLAEKYLSYFKEKIPNYSDLKTMEVTFSSIDKYLKFLNDKCNLAYEWKKVQSLHDLSFAKYTSKELATLEDILNIKSPIEKLNLLSQNPFEHIEEIYNELQYFDSLIKEKNSYFESKIDFSTINQVDEYRGKISRMLSNMIAIGKETQK